MKFEKFEAFTIAHCSKFLKFQSKRFNFSHKDLLEKLNISSTSGKILPHEVLAGLELLNEDKAYSRVLKGTS